MIPNSSIISLRKASFSVSPSSILPPGNSHQPAQTSCGGLLQANIRLSELNKSAPTTSNLGLDASVLIIREITSICLVCEISDSGGKWTKIAGIFPPINSIEFNVL